MTESDPNTLLQWLYSGYGDEREMQLMALEQICMLLLMSDNVDRCFESCPPRTFLPALCRIFLDDDAPDNVLEVTARAITYYLDVSAECTRRIIIVDGAVKAICNRLIVADVESRTSKDLAEQCVKVLDYICSREAGIVFEAGGLTAMLTFISDYGRMVHKDTLYSAMSVVSRLATRIEPSDPRLGDYVDNLSRLLKHDDRLVSDRALRCFSAITERFARKQADLQVLAGNGLLDELLRLLTIAAEASALSMPVSNTTTTTAGSNSGGGGSVMAASSSASVLNTSGLDSKQAATSVSAIIGLLSTLCRASRQVTHTLLRMNFPDAIEKALKGDEKCVLDTLRFIDVVLILIFEGGDCLPKNFVHCGNFQCVQKVKRNDPVSEWTNRKLVDLIRIKDTGAFIETIEKTEIDVNALDEVGQSLLNWASAFGTLEMVEYLCNRGADVNKGLRSSSLHYAACFGKADFVKVLLQYGANPELLDEEGKTALEKARERRDSQGHRDVIAILQSPPPIAFASATLATSTATSEESQTQTAIASEETAKGDPEIAPIYLKRFLPMFCDTFQATMIPNVRKYCLNFIRKLIQYTNGDLLREICGWRASHSPDTTGNSPTASSTSVYAAILVEILAFTLDNEDNEDGHLVALQIVQDLMWKAKDLFFEQFARFGLFGKVQKLMIDKSVDDETVADCGAKAVVVACGQPKQQSIPAEMQLEFSECKFFSWCQWTFCLGRECLYAWIDLETIVIELSYGSNGWFRFALDNKLSTMYSGGFPEIVVDDSTNRSEFFNRMTCAHRLCCTDGSRIQPMFPDASVPQFMCGNWMFTSDSDDDAAAATTAPATPAATAAPAATADDTKTLVIRNSIGTKQMIFLQDGVHGFMFHSTKETVQSFLSQTTNQAATKQFTRKIPKVSGTSDVAAAPSSATVATATATATVVPAASLKPKNNLLKFKIRTLAKEINEKFFKDTETYSTTVLAKLTSILDSVEKCLVSVDDGDGAGDDRATEPLLKQALCELIALFGSGHDSTGNSLTAFEIYSSGVIEVLLRLIGDDRDDGDDDAAGESCSRKIAIFRELLSIETNRNSLIHLIRKLIQVLENVEKFPVYLHDSRSSGYNLYMLTSKFKLRLEKDTSDQNLIDRTGKCLRTESLSTIGQLERYLLQMVAKQWHDYERSTFAFVRKLREAVAAADTASVFVYNHDFDENGLLYFIGTNGKTQSSWINPSTHGLVHVTSSDGKTLPYGQVDDILSRDQYALNCHTSDYRRAWFCIDLGVHLIPTCYTLRHARGYGRSALRNWLLQMSRDGQTWTTLYTHTSDLSLNEPGSTCTWHFAVPDDESVGWRYVRIQQVGKNASDQTYFLSLSGFEIYGLVTSVCEDIGQSYVKDLLTMTVSKQKKQSIRAQLMKMLPIGTRVVPGPDWRPKATADATVVGQVNVAADTKSDEVGEGTVIRNDLTGGWIQVHWDNGTRDGYQIGADNKDEIRLAGNRGAGEMVEAAAASKTLVANIVKQSKKLKATVAAAAAAATTSQLQQHQQLLSSSSAAAAASSALIGGRKSNSTTNLPEVAGEASSAGNDSAISGGAAVSAAATEQATSVDNLTLVSGGRQKCLLLPSAKTSSLNSVAATTTSSSNQELSLESSQQSAFSASLQLAADSAADQKKKTCIARQLNFDATTAEHQQQQPELVPLRVVLPPITGDSSALAAATSASTIYPKKYLQDIHFVPPTSLLRGSHHYQQHLREVSRLRLERQQGDNSAATATTIDTDHLYILSKDKSTNEQSSSELVRNNNRKNIESNATEIDEKTKKSVPESQPQRKSSKDQQQIRQNREKILKLSAAVAAGTAAAAAATATVRDMTDFKSVIESLSSKNRKTRSKALSIISNRFNSKDRDDFIKSLFGKYSSSSASASASSSASSASSTMAVAAAATAATEPTRNVSSSRRSLVRLAVNATGDENETRTKESSKRRHLSKGSKQSATMLDAITARQLFNTVMTTGDHRRASSSSAWDKYLPECFDSKTSNFVEVIDLDDDQQHGYTGAEAENRQQRQRRRRRRRHRKRYEQQEQSESKHRDVNEDEDDDDDDDGDDDDDYDEDVDGEEDEDNEENEEEDDEDDIEAGNYRECELGGNEDDYEDEEDDEEDDGEFDEDDDIDDDGDGDGDGDDDDEEEDEDENEDDCANLENEEDDLDLDIDFAKVRISSTMSRVIRRTVQNVQNRVGAEALAYADDVMAATRKAMSSGTIAVVAPAAVGGGAVAAPQTNNSRRRVWDDEFVLKAKFSALIPAFDPRPGRINVNQTTDIYVPEPVAAVAVQQQPLPPPPPPPPIVDELLPNDETRLRLVLRGPNMTGVPNHEIELTDSKWTLFKAVHELHMLTDASNAHSSNKHEKFIRVWEPMYTLVYSEKKKSREVTAVQSTSSDRNQQPEPVRNILRLLRKLFILYVLRDRNDSGRNDLVDYFVSKKLTSKLQQQLQETLTLTSHSLPDWCPYLNENYLFLFPFEVRQTYLNCTAYGRSRTIAWLQTQRDAILERQRWLSSGGGGGGGGAGSGTAGGSASSVGGAAGSSGSLSSTSSSSLAFFQPARRDELEYRIGRLKHERVKIPRRADTLLAWAREIMRIHADRKAILEVEFVDEEGTGLGPTLEFYALVAHELQRKKLAIWICDDDDDGSDDDDDNNSNDDAGRNNKFIHRSNGLFPAPLPQQSTVCDNACDWFWFLGVFLAKVLQDNRLVDIPLSDSFLKLFTDGRMKSLGWPRSEIARDQQKSWFDGILTIDDLMEIDPIRAKFLQKLEQSIGDGRDTSVSLRYDNYDVKLEDLSLTFTYSMSSRVFGIDHVELVPNGATVDVTAHNVRDYVRETLDFCLNRGIRRQMEAFRDGFTRVFPVEKLAAFTVREAKLMMCGDQFPQWTVDDIVNYTEPKLGFTKESAGFKRFVNVLMSMNGMERKEFLQFTTGCSSLPPGGLANLYPRLTIVRKVDAGIGSYPSVNTCVHYLKLPDYPSEQLMRERILAATKEKGFHLN